MPAPDSILKLVDHFAALTANLRQARYNETQTRREFIDPFFEALGWDVSNRAGYSEAYKDVIHEDALAVEGRSRAPDYAFRVGGRRVFFVEAKKPSVNLSEGHAPAFQLRRYAWTAKLPLSILTDFEEFAVYDCRSKPNPADKPAQHRLMLLNYRDYPARWDELYNIFSKEAVLQGRFDAYAETSRGKKGTADVDDDFLATIEGWRKALALNLALRNPSLTERDLNYAVQMTIDRILFLRIAEERGIERTDQLKDIAAEGEIYAGLVQLYRLADQRYNSGLFHFGAEKNRSTHPDTLTPALAVDDRVLKEIIRGLYPPLCPYAWYVLPAEILGQVYEQFLGRVIRLTPGHQAKVEEKPEVRKAGGVYYTPGYIVDYIVQQTVGRLLEGKTPAEASRLKIVDPACGSGSFLLGAYQHLLDWHLAWYTANNPASHARGAHPAVFETRHGWALTTDKKKEILLHSIYGVDIDPQAVEVTKLSLLLKVLEGDLPAASGQLGLRLERLLPDLGGNIQCGNSLIGTDYYTNRQMGLGLVDDAERYRVNAFDWQRAFPQVFQQGGFDAVIGNPPYIRIQALKEWAPTEVEYYKQRYKAASKGNYDIYVVFVEKALSLLNTTGRLGFILPSKFFATDYGRNLRGYIAEQNALSQIIDFGALQIFEQATTYTCLLFLVGSDQNFYQYARVDNATDLWDAKLRTAKNDLSAEPWIFADDFEQQINEKLLINTIPISELPSRIGRGSSSGNDNIFVLVKKDGGYFTRQGNRVDIETDLLRTPIYATDFRRYEFRPVNNEVIIFPYEVTPDGYSLISDVIFKKQYPKTYKYLISRRKELEERKQYKEWYGFSAPRNLDVHDKSQLLVPLLANEGSFCRLCEDSSKYCLMASGGFSITIAKDCGLSIYYVLGLLNSKLLFWRLRSISNVFRGGWITCTKQYVETLPIRTINFSDPAEAALHSRMVALVEQILSLHTRRAAAHNPQELEQLTRQIETVDRAIDALVYQLYNLTDDEIRLVEGGN